ncbi:MAG: DUF924 family protein, partial [Caulobacteraceae bacterium]
MTDEAADIIAFWREAGPKAWFAKNPAFDAEIRARFEAVHHCAARGELARWRADTQGALALLLLLDQFPRNLWRGSAHAFATDPLARAIAGEAVAAGHDRTAQPTLRTFFYLPFEHSENIADQRRAIALCEALERETGESARWARTHHDVIARFGRFPHRNVCLGRLSTNE